MSHSNSRNEGPIGVVRLYVDRAAPTGGDGSSWATAYKTLGDALEAAHIQFRRGTRVGNKTPFFDESAEKRPSQFAENAFSRVNPYLDIPPEWNAVGEGTQSKTCKNSLSDQSPTLRILCNITYLCWVLPNTS